MCCFLRLALVKLILAAGVQANVSCKDFGVETSNADPLCLSSTPLKRPPKRPCLRPCVSEHVSEWCIFHTNRKGKWCATEVLLTVNYLNLDKINVFIPPHQQVFKAMKLHLFKYETFWRHARAFIELAVIHHWKVTQDVNLQWLSQEEKVILGGDMRADSPGIDSLLK